jgi:diguanylate cyclase (GGDEF)-like protein/PAS domain S-box-containing protein
MNNFLKNYPNTFSLLLSKINEGIIIYDKDTSIIYVNSSASVILGINEDEILGKKSSDYNWNFIDQNYKTIEVYDFPINRIFRTNENIENELIGFYNSQNILKWIDINTCITNNENNEPVVLVIFSDVTDRKNAYDEAELFKQLVNVINIGITISDPSQNNNPLLYVNNAFTKMTGYTFEEAVGKNCRYLQKEDTSEKTKEIIRKSLAEKKDCEVILKNYKKNGELFYNSLNITPYFKEKKLKYFIGVQYDITKQIMQEKLLEEQTLYIQSILNAQSSLVLVNDKEKIVYANKALFDFFGINSLEDFLKNSSCICEYFLEDDDYFHLGKIEENENWINNLKKLDKYNRVVVMKDIENNRKYFQIDIVDILNSKYVITLNNITNNILKEEFLSNKAYHDNLTGVFNREYFYEIFMVKKFINKNTYGIIMLDIDNFKSINDTYGHLIGDEVLKNLTITIKNLLRNNDSVIRWGGEEFIIIIEVTNKFQIEKIADKLRKAVENIQIPNVRKFTASFGVTILKKDEDIKVSIQRADDALYKAKKSGKNQVIFE